MFFIVGLFVDLCIGRRSDGTWRIGVMALVGINGPDAVLH